MNIVWKAMAPRSGWIFEYGGPHLSGKQLSRALNLAKIQAEFWLKEKQVDPFDYRLKRHNYCVELKFFNPDPAVLFRLENT